MFGLGIFDSIKVVILGLVVITVGYLGWNYHHMGNVIAEQKTEIGSLKEGQKTLFAGKEKVDKFMAKMGQVKQRVRNVEDKTDAVPSVPDSAGDALVLDLLKPYGLRDDSIYHPTLEGQGGLKPAPRPRANPAPH